MDLILGMDIGVFLAWIGTLLAAVLCIVYGIYYQFFKKKKEPQRSVPTEEKEKEQGEDS
jgi:hypothetical protein